MMKTLIISALFLAAAWAVIEYVAKQVEDEE